MLSLTIRLAVATFSFFLAQHATAYIVSPAVTVRIVDVGHGSCSVVLFDDRKDEQIPDNRYYVMVYGAGGDPGRCSKGIELSLPTGVNEIDLLVLSDGDYEHASEAATILENYSVGETWLPMPKEPTEEQYLLKKALDKEILDGGTVRNLSKIPVSNKELGNLEGDAQIEFFGLGFEAIGVVVRISLGEESVLLTQSLKGREKLAPDHRCAFEEREMVRKYRSALKSSAILAPNHGSNSSSSTCFIEAVAPEYVVFQSGHRFQLPAKAVAERFMAFGVDPENIFRTDQGDKEPLVGGHTFEWAEDEGCQDGAGDDDVLIHLFHEAKTLIGYFNDGYYESCL